jgi:hypothetical protein
MTLGGSDVRTAEVRRAWQREGKVGMNRLALRRENINVQAAWGVRVGREEVGSAFSRIWQSACQAKGVFGGVLIAVDGVKFLMLLL